MNKSAHILIVDDEPDTVEILSRQLARENYTVRKAYNGKESLELLKKHNPDLWQRLGAMRPEMKCLFMSGYTADIIANRNVLDEGINFLQKPFSSEALAVKLREALSGRGSNERVSARLPAADSKARPTPKRLSGAASGRSRMNCEP